MPFALRPPFRPRPDFSSRAPAAGECGHALLKRGQEWQANSSIVSNGDKVSRVAALAMKRGKSVDFTGIGSGTLPTETPPDRRRKFTVIDGGLS
jgi:hypothetical protein